ncbi:MAG: hypothetical protein ACTHLE_19340, partial [Agriterribacter sp.]
MKKIFLLLSIVFALLLVLWLVPVEERKAIILKNRIEHIDRLVSSSRDWIKWYSPMRIACEKDTSACSAQENNTEKEFRLHMPGRQVKVQLLQGLQYHIEIAATRYASFVVAMSPGESGNETKLLCIYNNRLLWKVLPFVAKPNEADLLVQDLKTFVESPLSFYGYTIQIEQPQGIGLLTRQLVAAKSDLLAHVKAELKQLENFATANNVNALQHNVSFIPARGDSIEIIAGVVVNRQVTGNDSIRYMKVPPGQQILVADYHGVYAGKKQLYSAMLRYMTD